VLTFIATAGLILMQILFPLAGDWAKRQSSRSSSMCRM
jgi:hypothetical protein